MKLGQQSNPHCWQQVPTSSNQFQPVEFLQAWKTLGFPEPSPPFSWKVQDIPSDVVDVVCDLEMLTPRPLDLNAEGGTREPLGEIIHSNNLGSITSGNSKH